MSGPKIRALPAVEKEMLATVREAAKVGGWMLHHGWISVRSEPGWPDLVLCRPPEVLFVELKTERGAVSPFQQEWLDALTACGLDARVVRPDDLQELCERLLARRPRPSSV